LFFCPWPVIIMAESYSPENMVQSSLSIHEGLDLGLPTDPHTHRDPKAMDTQVPYIKWHGVCIEPAL
jgi:hypothetical protein